MSVVVEPDEFGMWSIADLFDDDMAIEPCDADAHPSGGGVPTVLISLPVDEDQGAGQFDAAGVDKIIAALQAWRATVPAGRESAASAEATPS